MEKGNTQCVRFTYDELVAQNTALSEELVKSNEEKDFVWKLWKDFQVENPSVTTIISSVIEREQEKSDAKDLKVLTIFEQKDKQISLLQELSADLQTQLNQCKERISELLMAQADWVKKSAAFEEEINNFKGEIVSKDELLLVKDKLLINEKTNLENKVNELLEENTLYKKTVDSLNDKLEEACKQMDNLNAKFLSNTEALKSVEAKLESEIGKNQEQLDENEKQRRIMKKVKEALADKMSEMEAMSKHLEHKGDQVHNNKLTINELSAKCEQQSQYIEHLKTELVDCERDSKQMQEQVLLIQNLERLQDETQHIMSRQEITYNQEINSFQNTIYQLKMKVSKLQKEASKMIPENKALKKKNSELKDVCEKLSDRENNLLREISCISLEIESIKSKIMKDQTTDTNQDKSGDHYFSNVNTHTQTTPGKSRYHYSEQATQTDETDCSASELDQSSSKLKLKREKLHNETQRLLVLKSDMNEENRRMKKKLLLLENQNRLLLEKYHSLEIDMRELQHTNGKLKDELVETLQKLQVTSDVLHDKSQQLEECSQELQTISQNQLKEGTNSKKAAEKLKFVKEELEVATSNCSKLSFQVKSLCGENEILNDKQKCFQERITKLEKMLNQKKTYTDDLKGRFNEVKSELEKKSEAFEKSNAKLKIVTDRENKDKVYIEKLKEKVNMLACDKSKLQESLNTLKIESDNKTSLLQETQHICHQAEAAINTMEKTASQQIQNELKLFEDKEAAFNMQYEKCMNRIREFKAFVKNFSQSLLQQIHERQEAVSRKKKEKTLPIETIDIFQKKACDIACSILNMSATDLEEFMKEGEDASSPTYEDNDIQLKLKVILGKEDNFERILTKFLLDLVDYYCSFFSGETQK